MARKRKGKDAGSERSPEFRAFEEAAKLVLKVPKSEIDRHLAEERRTKRPQTA